MTPKADSLPSKSSIFRIKTRVFPLLLITHPTQSWFKCPSWEHGKEGGGGGFGGVDVEAVN